jgi:hypothetical protein
VADIATVHQLRPVRVLVSGSDPEYVMRATDELTALGFEVMSTTSAERTAELATVQRANVVVLDTSRSLASAATVAAASDALPQPVRVLLAGNRDRSTRSLGYEVVPSQATGEELAAAVHRVYQGASPRTRRFGR